MAWQDIECIVDEGIAQQLGYMTTALVRHRFEVSQPLESYIAESSFVVSTTTPSSLASNPASRPRAEFGLGPFDSLTQQ